MMSAPARRRLTKISRIVGSRLIQPAFAAASTIAYSPLTLYAATGSRKVSLMRRMMSP